jgi:hypothetical protein
MPCEGTRGLRAQRRRKIDDAEQALSPLCGA